MTYISCSPSTCTFHFALKPLLSNCTISHTKLTLIHFTPCTSQSQQSLFGYPPNVRRRVLWSPSNCDVKQTAAWSDLSMRVSGPWGDNFCQCCMKYRQQCMQSLQCLHCMVDQNWTYMYNTNAQPCTSTPWTLSLVYITACIMGQGDPYHQPTTSHNTHTQSEPSTSSPSSCSSQPHRHALTWTT